MHEKMTELKCKCGCNIFEQYYKLSKSVDKVNPSTGKPIIMQKHIYVCNSCGAIKDLEEDE